MRMEKPKLIVVCGPTASGKTGLAIRIAKRLDGEIVSADSMQIYRGMNIGTAKPDAEEMQGVPHHLLDILDPAESFSVAQYVELAGKAIEDITARGKLPILTGGTGLYIDSLTRGIQFSDMQADIKLRDELKKQAELSGNRSVWNILKECDPVLAESLHENNLGRVIRAIEVFRHTGITMSEWQRRSKTAPEPYRTCMIGIRYSDRGVLYSRIDKRVEQMLDMGLLQEVKDFYENQTSLTSTQAIGYKELRGYIDGRLTLDEAVEDLKRETRRYAKRQLTWLRRDERINWLDGDKFNSAEELEKAALERIKESYEPYN